MKEDIEVEVPFEVVEALVHLNVVNEESRDLWEDYKKAILFEDKEFDINEALSVLGHAMLNDFMIRAVEELVRKTRLNED